MQANDMSVVPRSYMRQRSARVKFLGSLLAIVKLEDGSHLRVPVHQLSANGGLLQFGEPLSERLSVEVALHVGSATLQTQAEMLSPIWATRGYLQPFRFTRLAAQSQGLLKENLDALLKKSRGRRAVGLQWNLTSASHPPRA
jgi:hypothetical protein